MNPLKHFKLMADGTEIMTGWNGKYVCYIADLQIDNDGSGPSHGDPTYQSETTYQPSLNADTEYFVVTPPQVRTGVPPVVIGCLSRVTNLREPERWHWGVVGDVGPSDKAGECSYKLAKTLNPSVTHNSGDSNELYLYEMWPGIPAIVGTKQYKLQPA